MSTAGPSEDGARPLGFRCTSDAQSVQRTPRKNGSLHTGSCRFNGCDGCASVSRIGSSPRESHTSRRRGERHLSGTHVAMRLKRPTCAMISAGHRHRRLLPPARRGLALHPVGFAWPPLSPAAPVRFYRTLSPLTPTASGRDCSLLHVPSPQPTDWCGAFRLGSTVPCGVRTFLTAPAEAATERRPDAHTA